MGPSSPALFPCGGDRAGRILSCSDRPQLRCSADLLIEASGTRGYNSIAIRAASELNRNPIVNRKSTPPAIIAKRSGQAMVEFAIISFVLTAMLMGFLGIIVLGLGSFQNNIAAESAGRLLDQHPSLIKENFAEYFNDDSSDDFFDAVNDGWDAITARQVYRFLNEYEIDESDSSRRLYDERRLILSRSEWNDRKSLGLSVINESLLGQYIYDPDLQIQGQTEKGAYRFPGAVVEHTIGTETYQTVLIPLLPKPGQSGGIKRSFNVTSPNPEMFYPVSDDWVAPVVVGKVETENASASNFQLIMFHPSQPASTVQIRVSRDENGRPYRDEDGFYQYPVEADDDAIDELIGDPPSGYTLADPAESASGRAAPYGGKFGLGESFSFLKTVRPYRAVFETSSVFRMTSAPVIVNNASIDIPGEEGPPIRITTLAPIVVQYSAENTPIPLKDETEVMETSDIAVDPPFDRLEGAYETSGRDQSLNFDHPVILTPNTDLPDLRRYFTDLPISPPASGDNDFVHNVLRLLPDDEGAWRVSVSAEFELKPDMEDQWRNGHELKLSLYKNGVVHKIGSDEAPIDRMVLDPEDPLKIVLQNEIFIRAKRGDVLQVRVFTDDTTDSPPPYDVELTGTPLKNWVFFERIGD